MLWKEKYKWAYYEVLRLRMEIDIDPELRLEESGVPYLEWLELDRLEGLEAIGSSLCFHSFDCCCSWVSLITDP